MRIARRIDIDDIDIIPRDQLAPIGLCTLPAKLLTGLLNTLSIASTDRFICGFVTFGKNIGSAR